MLDFEKEFRTLVNDLKKKSFEVTQEALLAAAAEMARRLERITPSNTGLFKRSWKVKTYPNAGYVYNERGAGGINKGVPISNVAEYSRRGPEPFIFAAWEKNKNEIKNIFIKEFERRFR